MNLPIKPNFNLLFSLGVRAADLLFCSVVLGNGKWRVHAVACQPVDWHHFQRWAQCAERGAGFQRCDGLGEIQHPGTQTTAAPGLWLKKYPTTTATGSVSSVVIGVQSSHIPSILLQTCIVAEEHCGTDRFPVFCRSCSMSVCRCSALSSWWAPLGQTPSLRVTRSAGGCCLFVSLLTVYMFLVGKCCWCWSGSRNLVDFFKLPDKTFLNIFFFFTILTKKSRLKNTERRNIHLHFIRRWWYTMWNLDLWLTYT